MEMNYKLQKRKKLESLQRFLEETLNKIDKEMIQNDIEWMQLKSLLRKDSEEDKKTKEQNDIKIDIDANPNTAGLQLDIPKSHIPDDMEEFDSD